MTSVAGKTSVAGNTSVVGKTSVAALEDISVPDVNSQTLFDELNQDLTNIKTQLNEMVAKMRVVEKTVKKELKSNEKKKPVILSTKLPSGFAKPSVVTDELCAFMQKPLGSEIARTEATQYITDYVRTHKLQDMNNRRKIIPDETLAQVLHLSTAVELTYFNLQKYLNIHFSKK